MPSLIFISGCCLPPCPALPCLCIACGDKFLPGLLLTKQAAGIQLAAIINIFRQELYRIFEKALPVRGSLSRSIARRKLGGDQLVQLLAKAFAQVKLLLMGIVYGGSHFMGHAFVIKG